LAYQPLYAVIRDTNGERHSYTCRKKVKWVSFWLNSDLGEVLRVYAFHDGDKIILEIGLSERIKDKVDLRLNDILLKHLLIQKS